MPLPSTSYSTPTSRIMPPPELKNVPPFAGYSPRTRAKSANVQVVGPTKERMERFEDTIKARPPAHTMYHAARFYRIPNPDAVGQGMEWADVYRRAGAQDSAMTEKKSSKSSIPAAPRAIRQPARKMGVDEKVKHWNLAPLTPAPSTPPPPPPYPHLNSDVPFPSYPNAPLHPQSPIPRPMRQDTHPPSHPHAKAYPSSPTPPSRVILPIPSSLRLSLGVSGFKTPRTHQNDLAMTDGGSYTTTSSERYASEAEDKNKIQNKVNPFPLPPPTSTDIGDQYDGYRFVGPITTQTKTTGADADADTAKASNRGVKFDNQVEVRTFGADEEPRRAVRGYEAVGRWMDGKGWGDWEVGKNLDMGKIGRA